MVSKYYLLLELILRLGLCSEKSFCDKYIHIICTISISQGNIYSHVKNKLIFVQSRKWRLLKLHIHAGNKWPKRSSVAPLSCTQPNINCPGENMPTLMKPPEALIFVHDHNF